MPDTPRLDSFVDLLRSKLGGGGDVTPEDDVDQVDDQVDVTANLAVFPDDGPSSGEWVDIDEVVSSPTEEEMAAGKAMGEGIDIDNDDDTGGV